MILSCQTILTQPSVTRGHTKVRYCSFSALVLNNFLLIKGHNEKDWRFMFREKVAIKINILKKKKN